MLSIELLDLLGLKSSSSTVSLVILRLSVGAGGMAHWFRALSALPEVLSSIPRNHMVAHNHLY